MNIKPLLIVSSSADRERSHRRWHHPARNRQEKPSRVSHRRWLGRTDEKGKALI